jgi:hypothetical protein
LGQAQVLRSIHWAVDEERAGVVRGMGKTVLMKGLQWTVQEADVIRNQLQIAVSLSAAAGRC